MRLLIPGLFLALGMIATPVHSQSTHKFDENVAFTAADSLLLCDLLVTYPAINQTSFALFASNAAEERRLAGLADKLIWKNVPKKIKCGRKSVRLNSKRFGNFLDGFGLSVDGELAAYSGGYLYGPLMGGGGDCVFRKAEGRWKLEGCVNTWAA